MPIARYILTISLFITACKNDNNKVKLTTIESIMGPGRKEEKVRGPVRTLRECWVEEKDDHTYDTTGYDDYVFSRLGYKTMHYMQSPYDSASSKGFFNESARIFTEETFSKGKFSGRIESLYDDKGNLILRHNFNELHERVYMEKYRYDTEGNKIEGLIYEFGESVSERTIYRYNNTSQLIESKLFNAKDELLYLTTYEYDQKGNQIKENNFYHGQPSTVRKMKYDERGNMIEESIEHKDDGFISTHLHHYEYDNHGNWTKHYIQTPKIFIARIFTYY